MKTILMEGVKDFINNLHPDDRKVVVRYIARIGVGDRTLPLAERVLCEELPVYKIRVMASELPSGDWPKGIRILYMFVENEVLVKELWIDDLGDHRTCASNPGYSVYKDEMERQARK